ncbi:DUF2563 family protein [Mycolicibacterium sp. CH28]|uniref:DUF2563 family protein n=1 Tax=Mycolicibacterium sp. CH28 TaxID=2512237 RepID=UPI001081AF78|nr:DUF2563 family protein [Mycolicibacterium sp. CH28]TGD88995.1 DUF2563 family protein [Mycolicibacterium sp. CH28]
MQVDAEEMRLGANRSYDAADHAHAGADAFARVAVSSGIFGAFPAAESVGTAVTQSHAHHITRMRGHATALGTLGDKAHRAASNFIEMEIGNAEALREVLWPTTQA